MKKLLLGLLGIMVIATMVVLIVNMTSDSTETEDLPPQQETVTSQEPAASETIIVYTDSGFEPSDYTVSVGGTITVRNDSSDDLQFSSDSHPTHQDNPELNADTIEPGESLQLNVTTAGEWGFHDHLNHLHTGMLTVTD